MPRSRRQSIPTRPAILALIALAATPALGQEASFRTLGGLPDGDGGQHWSFGLGVSADGRIVVGISQADIGNGHPDYVGIQWTETDGMSILPDLPGGLLYTSEPAAVTTGGVAVGYGYGASSDLPEAAQWVGGVPSGMGFYGAYQGTLYSRAYDVTPDGTSVVGLSTSPNQFYAAFVWSPQDGMQALEDLPGGQAFGWAEGVSSDGGVVVGVGSSSVGLEAARWDSGVVSGLGLLPGGTESSARDVSLDGAVVVGISEVAGGLFEAFRWRDGQMNGLGVLPGANRSDARAVSADGEIIVGLSGTDAFIWSRAQGMRSLRDVLETEHDVDLGGWHPRVAYGVSADGTCIVGNAMRNGRIEAFVARVPREPDTDGDGLLDIWETEGGGIDVNGDGTTDLDLYALGARPDSKDLFVEIDVMATVPFLFESITDVVDAFAAAPVANPDGSSGIRLHAQVDELDLTFSETWGDDFLEFDLQKDERFGTPAQRNDPNAEHILAAKKRAYRYCIFANRMDDGSYGIAELPGNDCYLTLNSIKPDKVTERRPWRWWIAHVFMHELGHTLGLTHGGGFDTDGDDPGDQNYIANYKPNYISVMNYGFDVFREVRHDGHQWPLAIDFSREALIPLDESNLSEPVGIPSDEYAEVFAPYGYPASDGSIKIGWAVLDDPDGVDWNGDVDWDDTGVVQDITFWGADHPQNGGATPGDHLNGFNDWDLIRLPIGTDGDFADYTHATADYPEIGDDVITWHADHVPPPPSGCRVDLNEDNTVDTRDVIRFLGLWADRSGAADFNLDGAIDTRDVIAFLNAWTAGC